MRAGFLGAPKHITRMMIIFDTLFRTPKELDLKVTYLFHFLKVLLLDIIFKVSQDDFDMVNDEQFMSLLTNI